MCNCNTVTRDTITITIWSWLRPTPRKEPEVSDSGVRKKSEVRQKTVVRTLRFSPAEDETIRKKAEDSGLTVSAYIRNAALNKRINSGQMMLF